jgi:hypothetical protein
MNRPKGRQRKPVHTSLEKEVYATLARIADERGVTLAHGNLGALLDEAVKQWADGLAFPDHH